MLMFIMNYDLLVFKVQSETEAILEHTNKDPREGTVLYKTIIGITS